MAKANTEKTFLQRSILGTGLSALIVSAIVISTPLRASAGKLPKKSDPKRGTQNTNNRKGSGKASTGKNSKNKNKDEKPATSEEATQKAVSFVRGDVTAAELATLGFKVVVNKGVNPSVEVLGWVTPKCLDVVKTEKGEIPAFKFELSPAGDLVDQPGHFLEPKLVATKDCLDQLKLASANKACNEDQCVPLSKVSSSSKVFLGADPSSGRVVSGDVHLVSAKPGYLPGEAPTVTTENIGNYTNEYDAKVMAHLDIVNDPNCVGTPEASNAFTELAYLGVFPKVARESHDQAVLTQAQADLTNILGRISMTAPSALTPDLIKRAKDAARAVNSIQASMGVTDAPNALAQVGNALLAKVEGYLQAPERSETEAVYGLRNEAESIINELLASPVLTAQAHTALKAARKKVKEEIPAQLESAFLAVATQQDAATVQKVFVKKRDALLASFSAAGCGYDLDAYNYVDTMYASQNASVEKCRALAAQIRSGVAVYQRQLDIFTQTGRMPNLVEVTTALQNESRSAQAQQQAQQQALLQQQQNFQNPNAGQFNGQMNGQNFWQQNPQQSFQNQGGQYFNGYNNMPNQNGSFFSDPTHRS